MIEAIAVAVIAVVVTTMLATAPLFAAHELGGWGPFCAALPMFTLGLGQAIVIGRGKWRQPENLIGVAVLLAVAPFAAFLYQPMPGRDLTVLIIICVILGVVILFAILAGALLKVAEPLGWILGWGMAVSAFLVSAIIPSVPPSWAIWQQHPPPSYVHSLPSAGDLVVEGPPLTVRGYRYRLRAPRYESALCTLEVTGETLERTGEYPYACGRRTIRCDDFRRWCLFDDAQNAIGYTYDGQFVTLYDYGTTYERPGNLPLRVLAEILAVAAVVLLFRGRDSPDRQILSVSALVAATIGVALGVRMLI